MGWGNPGESGAGSQGHCNMPNAPHLTVDITIIIIIIIIIINMGNNSTCTIDCNYGRAATLSI